MEIHKPSNPLWRGNHKKGEYGTYICSIKLYMDKIISKLYRDSLLEEGCTDKISKKTQEEIQVLLKDKEGTMEEQEYECYRDEIFLAASAAEENGFVNGFKYAFRLFSECIQE